MNDHELLLYFEHEGLDYDLHKHIPVFTTAEADAVMKLIAGARSKNLFLKDKKKNYILVSIIENKKVDLKRLSEQIKLGRLSFCNESELLYFIGVSPGSVTPYGLIHDKDKIVNFFLDRDFMDNSLLNFHPLRNDRTVTLNRHNFLKFFDSIDHPPTIIDIPILK